VLFCHNRDNYAREAGQRSARDFLGSQIFRLNLEHGQSRVTQHFLHSQTRRSPYGFFYDPGFPGHVSLSLEIAARAEDGEALGELSLYYTSYVHDCPVTKITTRSLATSTNWTAQITTSQSNIQIYKEVGDGAFGSSS
jgi:hypothetical protein